ncbi:hypothetical protein LIER_19958 [Lithospermum erythrorhizon]|uniref:Uncharacterized protein n=1 Tax=Lithospermum erythrorhizon TaxID=34254 RepID=A0AAV3QMN1_LITER
MDIKQGPTESLKSYQKWYNDILLNIPEVNNKVVYMAFYRGLRYEKLKTTLVIETPLSKEQLAARVKQYVELKEIKTKETKGKYLRDVLTRKQTRSKSPRKQPVWERFNKTGGSSLRSDNMMPNHRRVPPLGKSEREQRKKWSRENHMKLNTIRNEEEEDNPPKGRDSRKRGDPHEEVEEIPPNQERETELFVWEQSWGKSIGGS